MEQVHSFNSGARTGQVMADAEKMETGVFAGWRPKKKL